MTAGSGRTYTLIVEDKFGSVTDEYTFEAGEIIIGRSRQCDIVLPSENVSRRHARLYTTRDGLFIEDLNSANGVIVNGRRILKPEELTDNSSARLGDYVLHIKGARKAEEDRPVFVRLVGLNLSVTDQVFEITGNRTLVGRGKDCGLVLVDPSVSRVHAKIIVRPDGGVMIEDLGSANGVAVNDRLVKAWELHEGDKIRLGNLEFLVEIPNANTVETPVGSGNIMVRAVNFLSSNMPWIVAGVCVLAVLILFILFIPDYLKRKGDTSSKATAEETVPQTNVQSSVETQPKEPEKSKIDFSGSLAEANALLAQGDLDGARQRITQILNVDPTNEDAARLSSKIDVESEDKRLLTQTDTALKNNDYVRAAQLLLQVRSESVFYPKAKARMAEIMKPLSDQRKNTCRHAESMDCYRIKALVNKLEKILK